MSNPQMVPWVTPQILLKLKLYDAFMNISALFVIWFKNYCSLNFAKNWQKLPSIRGKQDFPNFRVK